MEVDRAVDCEIRLAVEAARKAKDGEATRPLVALELELWSSQEAVKTACVVHVCRICRA